MKYWIGCDRSGFDFVDYEEGSQAMMFRYIRFIRFCC